MKVLNSKSPNPWPVLLAMLGIVVAVVMLAKTLTILL